MSRRNELATFRARPGRGIALLAIAALALGACSGKSPVGPGPAVSNIPSPRSPLRVLAVTPENLGYVAAGAQVTVMAYFSAPLDPQTLTDSTLTLTGPSGRVAGRLDIYQGGILQFTPSAPLESGAWYSARIRAGVRDVNGAALAYDYVWAFETEDVIAPHVVSVSPSDGATQIGTTAKWVVTFSEAVDPSTVTVSGSFRVSGPDGDVPGVLSYSSEGRVVTFTPSQELKEFQTTYTLTLGAIYDWSLNALDGTRRFSFTTVVAPANRSYYFTDIQFHRLTLGPGGSIVKLDNPAAIPTQAWRIESLGDGTYAIRSAALPDSYDLDGGDGTTKASMQSGLAPSRRWRFTRAGTTGSSFLLWLPETLGEGFLLGHCMSGSPGSMFLLCMGARDDSQLYQWVWNLERVTDQGAR
jgi:hypothetical protein